jgi:hypothetical protein
MVLKSPYAQMGLVSELVQKECEPEPPFPKRCEAEWELMDMLPRMRITTGDFKSSSREAGHYLCRTGDR